MVSDQIPEQDPNTGQRAETTRLISYFIQYNNVIYLFHGLSSIADFSGYSNYFKRTMTNFTKLTDPSKINVQPTRIDVKSVTRAGTLQQALQQLGAANQDLNELSIINGMTLTEQVSQGDLLKLFTKTYNVRSQGSTNGSNSTTNTTNANNNTPQTNTNTNSNTNNNAPRTNTNTNSNTNNNAPRTNTPGKINPKKINTRKKGN